MRSSWFFSLLALLVVALVAPNGHAATVQSSIEVPSRSDSDRATGAIRALHTVLGELFPPDHPLTSGQRRELAGEANDFVQRYGYLTGASGQILLQLQFDEVAIKSRVKELVGDPDDAPGVEAALLWLVVVQDTQDLMLTEGAGGVLPDTLDQIAAAIGQPLVYPKDDVLSSGVLTTLDVRTVNESKLTPASAQYPVGQVVVLRMVPNGDQWRGEWTLLGTGDQWTSAGSLGDMLQIGLTAYQGRAAAIAASEQADQGFGSRAGDVTFSVGGTLQPTEYAWLVGQLRDRFPTGVVRVVSVSAEEMTFAVGDVDDVATAARTLATIPQLQLVSLTAQDRSAFERPVDLSYLLVR